MPGWIEDLVPVDTDRGRVWLGTCRLCGAAVRIGPAGCPYDSVQLHHDWHNDTERRLLDAEAEP